MIHFIPIIVSNKKFYISHSFKESHGHFFSLARNKIELDLTGITSKKLVLEKINHFEATLDADAVLIGFGWNETLWMDDPSPLTWQDLKIVTNPNRLIVLSRIDGHCYVVNEALLKRLGILHDNPPDIPGGLIERDLVTKKVNGRLLDKAQNLVRDLGITKPDSKRIFKAAQETSDELLQMGVTSFTDAWTRGYEFDWLKELHDQRKLKLNIHCMLDSGDAKLVQRAIQTEPLCVRASNTQPMFTASCFKFFADGALGSRGAWLKEPYSDDPKSNGIKLIEFEDFFETALKLFNCGYQLATHAIGDAANSFVLDVYEAIAKKVGMEAFAKSLPRIEHVQHICDFDLKRMQKLGVIAAFQAQHATSDWMFALDRLGKNRLEQTGYRWRDFLKYDLLFCNGSDTPIEKPDPMLALFAAITRKPADVFDFPSNADEQTLGFEEAWLAGTFYGAKAIRDFRFQKPQIELAKLPPDFCLWSSDISRFKDPLKLLSQRPVATFVNYRCQTEGFRAEVKDFVGV